MQAQLSCEARPCRLYLVLKKPRQAFQALSRQVQPTPVEDLPDSISNCFPYSCDHSALGFLRVSTGVHL